PVCTLLRQHHIGHVGILHAEAGCEVVRNQQSGTFMMACFEGEGDVLADGAWRPLRAGECCLLPPFVRNAFRCVRPRTWKFAWVRYEESRESAPIVSSLSPVIGQHPPLPLKLAIEGLHAELRSGP